MSEIELPIITKYRPDTWDTVIGNEEMIAALRKTLQSSTRAHAYLFTGPSGTGKTTTARIVASELDCDVVEIDAASYSSVEDARNLVDLAQHRPLTGASRKMFLIDECHAMSKAAWQALLKLIEEPPEHLFIALCTTELHKVPATIQQRCFHVLLRPVKPILLTEFVDAIAQLEEWQLAPDVLDAIVEASQGSPRKALTVLQAVHDAPSRDEVKRIIQLQTTSEPVIELLKYIMGGGKAWGNIKKLFAALDDSDFENNLVSLSRYLITMISNANTDADAFKAWEILDALCKPANTFDAKTIFYRAIGMLLFTE